MSTSWEALVKYVILIYSNPMSRKAWEGFSDAERAEGLAAYAAFDEELAASGELIVSQALADPSLTRPVSARADRMSTDGPFAEVKEHLAGFLILECENIERAIEIAEQVPEAGLGLVEVRPVRNLVLTEF